MNKYRYRKERSKLPIWLAMLFFVTAIAIVAIMLTAAGSPIGTTCRGGEVGNSCQYAVFLPQIANNVIGLGWTFGYPCQGIECPQPTPVW